MMDPSPCPTEEVLLRLGIPFTLKGVNKLSACCPFHSEKTPSFFVYRDTGYYRRFGCGANGNLNDLTTKLAGKTIQELGVANQSMPLVYGLGKKKRTRKQGFSIEGNFLDVFDDKRIMDFCWSIGMSRSFVESFQVKWFKEASINGTVMYNRIVIPCVFNGKIQNYECRDFTKRSGKKILYPSGSNSEILFNYDNIDPTQTVFIVEGIKGLGKIWNMYSRNVISTFGKIIKDNQKEYINKLGKICVVPDNDTNKIDARTGLPVDNIKQTMDVFGSFYQKPFEIAYIPYAGKDPNDLNRGQLREVLDNRKLSGEFSKRDDYFQMKL